MAPVDEKEICGRKNFLLREKLRVFPGFSQGISASGLRPPRGTSERLHGQHRDARPDDGLLPQIGKELLHGCVHPDQKLAVGPACREVEPDPPSLV